MKVEDLTLQLKGVKEALVEKEADLESLSSRNERLEAELQDKRNEIAQLGEDHASAMDAVHGQLAATHDSLRSTDKKHRDTCQAMLSYAKSVEALVLELDKLQDKRSSIEGACDSEKATAERLSQQEQALLLEQVPPPPAVKISPNCANAR